MRLNALSLLCDHNKSTERVSSRDLELIEEFLVNNLNEQQAGDRQHMMALYKKVGLIVFICTCKITFSYLVVVSLSAYCVNNSCSYVSICSCLQE